MPQVDFYILDQSAADARLTVACRIAEKAMLSDFRVWICTGDAGIATRLNDLLWTFSQSSFVPHRLLESDVDIAESIEPVLIARGEPPEGSTIDVLINLAAIMPTGIERYQRIAEVLDGDEQRRQQGRERFRDYRERGCKLESHTL